MDKNYMNKLNLIESWFLSKKSLYFFLPDGPEGRPFDNIYYFKTIELKDNRIHILLSNEISFFFEENATITPTDDKLIVSEFKALFYTKGDSKIKKYYEGELCFAGY